MKPIALLPLLALLVACGVKVEQLPNSKNLAASGQLSQADFTTVCLDGTEYWLRVTGYPDTRAYMAPRFDRTTREPKAC